MLELCARYHDADEGSSANASHSSTLAELGGPGYPCTSSVASAVSRRSRSLTMRHHGLPGRSPWGDSSTPRAISARRKASSERAKSCHEPCEDKPPPKCPDASSRR